MVETSIIPCLDEWRFSYNALPDNIHAFGTNRYRRIEREDTPVTPEKIRNDFLGVTARHSQCRAFLFCVRDTLRVSVSPFATPATLRLARIYRAYAIEKMPAETRPEAMKK
jgi:hypothetical protein